MGSKSTGSREHGAKKTKEQGAKESNLGCREQKILGIVSKNLTEFLGFFFASLSSPFFSDTYFAFHHQYITHFDLSPLPDIPLIQGSNEGNLRE